MGGCLSKWRGSVVSASGEAWHLHWRSVVSDEVERLGVALALKERRFSKWRGVALAVFQQGLCRKRRG